MLDLLRRLAKNLPIAILALALAVAVWISAVTATDPNDDHAYPRPVPITYIGQDPGMLLIEEPVRQMTLSLKAPRSIWDRLTADMSLIKAQVDLYGLGPGVHRLPVQVNVALRPVEITGVLPDMVTVKLEALATITMDVHLLVKGEPAVGFQAGDPVMLGSQVTVSGPDSLVTRVNELRAQLDLTNAKEDVRQVLDVQALDTAELPVTGVTLSPDKITVNVPITQRGGYRNMVVKVIVTGQIASGFRLSNVFVFPPVVTVFSSNPSLVENMPGYVETVPINLNGARDGLDLQVRLNLPTGIQLVGDQTVNVQVAITAIEGSLTLANMKVDTTGLDANMEVTISPDRVDVILSGPLYLLDKLSASQVRVYIDLTGRTAGTYQLFPTVVLDNKDIRVESLLPGTIEVIIINVTPTPTPTISKTRTVTPKPTLTPTPTRTPSSTPG
jgi:YbbR domain-containing protein